MLALVSAIALWLPKSGQAATHPNTGHIAIAMIRLKLDGPVNLAGISSFLGCHEAGFLGVQMRFDFLTVPCRFRLLEKE